MLNLIYQFTYSDFLQKHYLGGGDRGRVSKTPKGLKNILKDNQIPEKDFLQHTFLKARGKWLCCPPLYERPCVRAGNDFEKNYTQSADLKHKYNFVTN